MYACLYARNQGWGQSRPDKPSLRRASYHVTWARWAGQAPWQQTELATSFHESSAMGQVQGCQGRSQPDVTRLQEGTEKETLCLKATPRLNREPPWDPAEQILPTAHLKTRHLHPLLRRPRGLAAKISQKGEMKGEYPQGPDNAHRYMSAVSPNGHIYLSWDDAGKVLIYLFSK